MPPRARLQKDRVLVPDEKDANVLYNKGAFGVPQSGGALLLDLVEALYLVEHNRLKVDGHDAWYLQSHLTFDIQGLRTKGETMTIVIVSAGATSGLYYSSIPDDAKQYQAPADKALSELTVDK